jgi:hypothetical protein
LRRFLEFVMAKRRLFCIALLTAGFLITGAVAQTGPNLFTPSVTAPFAYDLDYPELGYSNPPRHNPVAALEAKLAKNEAQLRFKPGRGYLDSLLEALGISPTSQVLVYSQTSLQKPSISARTPRAIYFGDDVFVAWVQGSTLVEVATTDRALGTVFYTFDNAADQPPQFEREKEMCLSCHDSLGLLRGGTPQLLARSAVVNVKGEELRDDYIMKNTGDATPIKDRWGGWYVTGHSGKETHLGNILVKDAQGLSGIDDARRFNLETLEGQGFLDTSPYLTAKSDIVALMTLEHEITVQNEITFVRFKAGDVLRRIGHPEAVTAKTWDELPPKAQQIMPRMLDRLTKSLLFFNAVQFTDRISGTAGFEAAFEKRGPRDDKGRSLRDFDLDTRLFRYAVSFLIYSPEFDALPGFARDYVYRKVADVLEGRDTSGTYGDIPQTRRRETLEVLAATKPDFKPYLKAATAER